MAHPFLVFQEHKSARRSAGFATTYDFKSAGTPGGTLPELMKKKPGKELILLPGIVLIDDWIISRRCFLLALANLQPHLRT